MQKNSPKISFKSYGLKGHWKVLLSGHVIGFIAKPWLHLPYHRLLLNGEWSEKTYKNRMQAAEDILSDLSNSREKTFLKRF